jgi:hypothetical protein
MDNYYHFSDIKQLLISQSLDGERTPIFKVILEEGAVPALMVDVANNRAQHLYVHGINQKYAYLPTPNEDDKDAYREVASDHLKFKTAKVTA